MTQFCGKYCIKVYCFSKLTLARKDIFVKVYSTVISGKKLFFLSSPSPEDNVTNEINYDNPLGTGGQLVTSFAVLMKLLWSQKYKSYAPSKFKVCFLSLYLKRCCRIH